MVLRNIKLVWFAAAAALIASAHPVPAQPIRWDMPTEYPRDSMPGAGIDRFATELNTRSGARITVTPSFDGALGFKSIGLFTAVETGQLPAGDSFAGSLGEKDPIFLLSSLPFLATSFDDARQLYEGAVPYYAAALQHHHQRLLYATPWPPSGLWAKRLVTQPADLKGLSIRTYDETSTVLLKTMGAEAVNISFANAMPRLKDGSIQGVLSSGDGGAGRKLWEFLPNFTALNYAAPLSFATINAEAYAALPPDLRQAVDDAAQATEIAQWKLIQSRVDANLAQMTANGVTIAVKISPDLSKELLEAAQRAVQEWARKIGPDGDAILAAYRARH